MQIYIALLRGINVGGHNKIKMTELKQLCLELNFKNITTYIQSGNIIFKTFETNKIKIEKQLVNALKNQFDYTIKVLILSKNELESIFKSNPFLEKYEANSKGLYVTILNKKPDLSGVAKINELNTNSNDEFIIKNKCIYLYFQNGSAPSKLSTNLFENKLKVNATTRNWRTLTKLVELSNL